MSCTCLRKNAKVCAFHPHDHQKIAVLMHHIAALEDKVAELEKQLKRVRDEAYVSYMSK